MKNNLFRRLLTMNLLIIGVTLLIVAFLLSRFASDYIYTQKEKELLAKGTEVSEMIIDYQEGIYNEFMVLSLMEALDRFWDARIWVSDRNGLVLLASFGDRPARRNPAMTVTNQEELESILQGDTVTIRHYMPHFNETMLTIGVPIRTSAQGPVLGAIFLHAPVIGIEAAAGQMRQYIALSGLAAVIAASILGYFYSLRLSRPLHAMSDVALRMAKGEFTQRVVTDSEDEIGQLGQSLNLLSTRLQETMGYLHREKEKFESMVTSMHEGVIGLDHQAHIVFYNEAAAELLPLTPDHLSVNVETIFPQSHVQDAFRHVFTTGEHAMVVVRGEMNILSVHISLLKEGEDALPGAVVLIQDISETEKIETMRREFIANISHELRTPLTTIRGFSESLLDGTAETEAQKNRYISLIAEESRYLGNLIQDLLDLNRLESGKTMMDMIPFRLSDTLTSLTTRMQPLFEKHALHLQLEIPDEPVVMGDSTRVQQVLRNLLENAARYAESLIRIRVQRVPDKNEIRITISDDGPGIPVEELPYVFQRFYRVEKSRTRGQGGTGLGLAIARQIVEAHDGTITAGLSKDGGAEFVFTLPIAIVPEGETIA